MASPTAISPQTSSTSPTSTAEYPDYITPWDENLEARLQYNKKELGASQKRWSESQELWLDEVRHSFHDNLPNNDTTDRITLG